MLDTQLNQNHILCSQQQGQKSVPCLIIKGEVIALRGGASLNKTLLSTPHPPDDVMPSNLALGYLRAVIFLVTEFQRAKNRTNSTN